MSIGVQSIDYLFGRSTAGLTRDTHQPFVVEMTGKSGQVWLEDLANMPGSESDWDYNDRSWHVTIQAFERGGQGSRGNPGSGSGTYSLIDSGSWTWTNSVGQSASVSYEITSEIFENYQGYDEYEE